MISIISPMYNEQGVIEKYISRVDKKMRQHKLNYELILVDDGSTDKTLAEAKAAAKKFKTVRVVKHAQNFGRGRALRSGFAEAKGDILVTIESDSSWGEQIIVDMVAYLKKNTGKDMVIASPHLKGGGYKNVPKSRIWISELGNFVFNKVFGGKVTMASGMTRAYRREVIDSLVLSEDRKEIHLEILSKALLLGFKVGEVPATITWAPGKSKIRKNKFVKKRFLKTHLLFSFNESPIFLMGTLSVLFLLAGLVIASYLLYTFFQGYLNPDRPLVILMLLLIIVSIQSLLFAFLAYQNKDLYKQQLQTQKQLKELKNVRN